MARPKKIIRPEINLDTVTVTNNVDVEAVKCLVGEGYAYLAGHAFSLSKEEAERLFEKGFIKFR